MNSAGLWRLHKLRADDLVLQSLVCGQTRTTAQLFLEQPNLLLRVFDDCLLSAVHPPSKATQSKRQRIHRKSISLPTENHPRGFGTDDFRTSRSTYNINGFGSFEFSD